LALKLRGQCAVSDGHTSAWGKCVLRCPIESTINDASKYWLPLKFNNLASGASFDVSGVLYWAAGSANMYIFTEQFTTTECNPSAAEAINSVFAVGDIIDVSLPNHGPSVDGSTFLADKVLAWAHGGSNMCFLPSDRDKATCDDTVATFNSKFPYGRVLD
jgi:hypothetical protein